MAKQELDRWVESWLEKRGANSDCSVCGKNEWLLGEIADITLQGLRKSIYPVLPLFCGNCAHVVFFNALMMGLVGGVGEPSHADLEVANVSDAETRS